MFLFIQAETNLKSHDEVRDQLRLQLDSTEVELRSTEKKFSDLELDTEKFRSKAANLEEKIEQLVRNCLLLFRKCSSLG